jgi:hypothetical protein
LSQNGERKEAEEVKIWDPRTAFFKRQLWAKIKFENQKNYLDFGPFQRREAGIVIAEQY